MVTIDQHVGDRLAQARRAKGLSQSQLALLLLMPTSALIDYEAGRRRPPPEAMIATAELLGVTYEWLFEDGPLPNNAASET